MTLLQIPLLKIYDFMYQTQHGAGPQSGVVVAANGVVYGTTSSGCKCIWSDR
jgi:hypothetical protein